MLNPLTLTAQWSPGVYAITLNNQSATSAGTATIYEKYATGWYSNAAATTSITTITKPTKTGYTFKGYYTSTNCSGTQRINASGTITAGNTTYTGTGTLYACWEQDATPFPSTLTTMQGMTSAICNATTDGQTKTLTDTRDSNTYTVFKGKDGKCWMSQNLRLINKTITSSNSNVSSSFTVPNNNWSSSLDQTAKYTNPYTYDSGDTDYGVYYNYAAATAGTILGEESNTTEASRDICPKGWKLPSHDEQSALLSAYGVTNDAAGSGIITSPPLNFVYSGYIEYNWTSPRYQGSSAYLRYGNWWSSTAMTGTWRYNIVLGKDVASTVNGNPKRCHGYTIRCVAK